MSRVAVVPFLLAVAAVALGGGPDAPSHGRPFFMPEAERARIRGLIEKEPWAKEELARLRAAAEKGDGFQAAFLYALDGDASLIPTAAKWLLGQFGPKAWSVKRARDAFSNPDFFKGGQPHLADVYYQIDVGGFVAFDWAYNGLDPADRKAIQEGIVDHARFRIRCMDRWSQTANLVFKPTFVVAMAGLATGDAECLQWGFHREPRHGNGLATALASTLSLSQRERGKGVYPQQPRRVPT